MQANCARKQALLIGAGWTFAAAAALAFFKSSSFEPIYLWSLGVVAFGWAGALLRALAAEQGAASVSLVAAGCESRAVVDALARAMSVEMQCVRSELARVDELLEHAIEQLMLAFNSVSDQARRHQDALALQAAAAEGTAAAAPLRAAAERFADSVNGAVTALQFRDVAGQKLGHVRRQLEALEQVLQQIREASGALPATARGQARVAGQVELAARVRGLLRELEQAKAASPAQQALMHAGAVDLF